MDFDQYLEELRQRSTDFYTQALAVKESEQAQKLLGKSIAYLDIANELKEKLDGNVLVVDESTIEEPKSYTDYLDEAYELSFKEDENSRKRLQLLTEYLRDIAVLPILPFEAFVKAYTNEDGVINNVNELEEEE